MEIHPAVRQRRKEIRDEAKRILIGKVLYHPYFPHDIYINVSGIKEWLNQPHKHYAEKNEALLQLPELLMASEYLGAKPDPKGRDFIRNGHIFKTTIADEASWIIISETIWGECLVHSVSDDYPYINETLLCEITGPLNPSLRICNPTRYSEALLFSAAKIRKISIRSKYFGSFLIIMIAFF